MTPHPLFRALVDDAALFPPGDAPMAQAVPEHDRHTRAWYGDLVGPFLCTAQRLPELRALLSGGPLSLGLIATRQTAAAAITRVMGDPLLWLRAVDVPIGGIEEAHAAATVLTKVLPGDVTGYVEVPLTSSLPAVLDVLAGHGLRAKLRVGGLTATAFPTERQVADVLHACLARNLPVKFTAGLHHAVRHTAPDTGFEHHGFLNVLLAVHLGLGGAAPDDLAATLAERDHHTVAKAIGDIDDLAATRIRRAFTSYGSCSISDPVNDLVGLGLLGKP